MKIYNPLTPIPFQDQKADSAARPSNGAPSAFQTILKEQCQEPGGLTPPSITDRSFELAGSVLDLLERIAAQIDGGVSARDMAATHKQLARQTEQLKHETETLPPGPLKDLVNETAALSYVQLWRFEQGDVV